MAEMTEKKYKIYSLKSYKEGNEEFIKKEGKEYDIKNIEKELRKDNYYNFRINKGKNYIFFGDVDGLEIKIEEFIKKIKDFMLKNYGLRFIINEFKYTRNENKEGSYHYSIPKWNCSCEKLKEIHLNLKKEVPELKKNIDTTVYSNHWYRCPNQTKGDENVSNKHKVIEGKLENFIIEYIPKNSENIENAKYIGGIISKKIKAKKNIIVDDEKKEMNNSEIEIIKKEKYDNKIVNYDKELLLSKTLSDSKMYKKLFDECYKQERFDKYEFWMSIGMAIKNTFGNMDEAFELFNYYSAKGRNYEGEEKTKYKFLSFEKKDKNGFTIATVHFYAIEDNKPKFIEIMNKNTFELGQTDICKYLKILVGYKFIYKQYGTQYKLYCYNGKYWQNDDILLKKCISTVLYDFLKMILVEVYWNTKEFNSLKSKIEKLKLITHKKDIIETYKEYGVNNEIKFDNKWWLFGFTNVVYDMKERRMREYNYDDYVSTTCGYEWREPTEEEMKTVNDLIESVMPIKEERELYLQILCTGIDGRCLEKFIIFNGCGGNGKGVMNDLMLTTVGNHGMIGNNGILFENSKTGSNPEKSNLHKKRYVVFRETSEKKKFENSIMKEMTGGGKFSARTHNEKETEKELNLTMTVECNKKPLFTEEPKESEVRRIIDLPFRSTFVTNKDEVDEKKYVYMGNPMFKTEEFQQKHKYALIKILINEHKKYIDNGSIITLPESIKERTKTYLELSCNILQWFKDNYEETEEKNIIKIKDIYELFCGSEYFFNLSKFERRKYNKNYFVNYFETNIFLRKYYKERHNNTRNVILCWKKKEEEE